MTNWHVWTVVSNRQNKINEFLRSLDSIEEFIYPTAAKEYNTKKGKRVKDVPIYSNYIFIKYDHAPIIETTIKRCPWISEYVGKCSYEEIDRIKRQTNLKYDELVNPDELQRGSNVKMVRTPFAGWEATIIDIIDNKLDVKLCILGADRIIRCSKDDVELISR